MRRRFRRKRPVLWLPQPGTAGTQRTAGISPLEHWAGLAVEGFVIDAATGDGLPTTVSAPLVVDNPPGEDLATTTNTIGVWQNRSLVATQQIGYRLKRIVGDLVVVVAPDPTPDQDTPPCGCLVELGIIVRRVSENGQPLATASDEDIGSLANNADPWVWRRNFVLSTGSVVAPAQGAASLPLWMSQFFPLSNWGYGNSRQHVDQKTARRIGPEERLFFDATFWPLPFSAGSISFTSNIIGTLYFDYRVLATTQMNSGNRRNASR